MKYILQHFVTLNFVFLRKKLKAYAHPKPSGMILLTKLFIASGEGLFYLL